MQCEDAHQHKKVFDQMTCLKCFVFCIKTVILLIGLGTDNTKWYVKNAMDFILKITICLVE